MTPAEQAQLERVAKALEFDCDGGGNLIAVSHIIARRQNKPLIDACIRAFQRPTDEPPQPPRAA